MANVGQFIDHGLLAALGDGRRIDGKDTYGRVERETVRHDADGVGRCKRRRHVVAGRQG